MELASLLSTGFHVPSVPRVEALLLTELAQQNPDLRRIDQFIGVDPALTLRLLQAANAPAAGLCGQIHSVSEALAVISLGRVHAMVADAASSASPQSPPGISMPQFWAYSLDCAKVARSVAALVRLNQQAAYSCGLIHAVGELLMREAMPEVVALDAQMPVMGLVRARFEHHALGFCYSQTGAGLARQWRFPQVLIDALEHQHAPFEDGDYEPMAGVLHLAVWRARARQAGLRDNALTVTFPSAVAEVLGLDIDMVLQQDPIDWTAQTTGRSRL